MMEGTGGCARLPHHQASMLQLISVMVISASGRFYLLAGVTATPAEQHQYFASCEDVENRAARG